METLQISEKPVSLTAAKIRLMVAAGIALFSGLLVGAATGLVVFFLWPVQSGSTWDGVAAFLFGIMAGLVVAYGTYVIIAICLMRTWLTHINPLVYPAIFVGPVTGVYLPVYMGFAFQTAYGWLLTFVLLAFGPLLLAGWNAQVKAPR